MNYHVRVDIKDLVVDEDHFDFKYELRVQGQLVRKEGYYGVHKWGPDYQSFHKILSDHYALSLVMQAYFKL